MCNQNEAVALKWLYHPNRVWGLQLKCATQHPPQDLGTMLQLLAQEQLALITVSVDTVCLTCSHLCDDTLSAVCCALEGETVQYPARPPSPACLAGPQGGGEQ